MLRDKQVTKDKEIRALVREMDDLRSVTWNAPIVKLDKPYQNGWLKYHVLRDDYSRRNDADVYQTILKKIGGFAFCRKQDFIDRTGKEFGPHLNVIGKNEWEGLGWPDHYKKHFYFGVHRVRYNNGFGFYHTTVTGYRFGRDFCFVHAVKPHMVTHIKTVVPEAESRLKEIKNKFEAEQLWARYNNLKGRKSSYSSDYYMSKQRYLEALGTTELEKYDES